MRADSQFPLERLPELQEGSREAWAELYDAVQKRLCKRILQWLWPRADAEACAEDLFQETFCRAYVAIANFRGDCRMETWLYRIAQRTTWNFIRDVERRKTIQLSTPSPRLRVFLTELLPAKGPDPEDLCMSVDGREKLQKAIADVLPPTLSPLVILYYLEDWDQREIAEHLRVPLGTVSSYLSQARRRLQAQRAHFTAFF